MRSRLAVLVAIVLSAVATTAAASSEAAGSATCTPDGAALAIAAKEKKFDKDCLAAPADTEFTIAFDNQDPAVPHNVSIYDTSVGEKTLFKGDVIVGPSRTTYAVPALPAGTYEFRCDPHDDTMLGTFVVS